MIRMSVGHILIVLLGVMATTLQWPFQSYPAVVSKQKPVPVKLETPKAKLYRTAIRKAVRRGPNFAGHYTVAGWGCGTECGVFVIVDDSTGKVYEPPEISRSVDLGFDGPHFRADSNLMVVASCPDPVAYGLKNCQRNFYRWNGRRLILLSSEPVTEAECAREFPKTHCIDPNDF
jgi:hypothetical protein